MDLLNRYKEKQRKYCIKIVLPLVYLVIFIFQCQIDVLSKHYRVAFNINVNNISNYLGKLYSLRMFYTAVGSFISYIIYTVNILSINFQSTLSLGLLMLVRLLHFLTVHLSRNKALHVYYISNVEAFLMGFFQLTVLSKAPKYTTILTLCMDIASVVASIIQIVADLFFYGTPLLIIKSQSYIAVVVTIVSFCFWIFCVNKVQDESNIDSLEEINKGITDLLVDIAKMSEDNDDISLKNTKYKDILDKLLEITLELKEKAVKLYKDSKQVVYALHRTNFLLNNHKILKQILDNKKSYTEEGKIKEDMRRMVKILNHSISTLLREFQTIDMEIYAKGTDKQTVVEVEMEPVPNSNQNFFDRFITLVSPFMMVIVATFFKEFLIPRILPFALLEKEKSHLVMILIPFMYISGSLTVYFIDKSATDLEHWKRIINAFWVFAIPMISIFIVTILAIHTKLSCTSIIINSQVIVLIMITTLVFCYSIMRSACCVFVANFVTNSMKTNKSDVNILLVYNIMILFYQYFFCKLSMGYNKSRIALGYCYPSFKSSHSIKYGNSMMFWITETMYRGYKEALSDHSTEIKTYI